MKFVKLVKASNLTEEDKKLAEKYFIECVEEAQADAEFGDEGSLGDYYDIREKVRSLESENIINQEQYNYILGEWDNILKKHNLL